MKRRILRLARQYPDTIRGVLLIHAEGIMTISKRDFVPVDLGALRSSGFVRQPQRGAGRLIRVELVYGGPAVTYAIDQHENETYSHTVGQAGYLRIPLMNAVPTLMRDMARDLDLDKTARNL